jgi:Zn-finger nucleic acid-binding protein
MRCPIDETTLVMSERNGIEIDYCPQQQAPFPQQGYGQQPYRKKRENWLSELFD